MTNDERPALGLPSQINATPERGFATAPAMESAGIPDELVGSTPDQQIGAIEELMRINRRAYDLDASLQDWYRQLLRQRG
jgi:hypothetical protein